MPAKNVLFIMCDQLRWDYLSCYGHVRLHTPNINKLAERGVDTIVLTCNRRYVEHQECQHTQDAMSMPMVPAGTLYR